MCDQSLSHVQLFASPWTVVHQAHLSMEFSREECWSRLPIIMSGNLLDSGIEPTSLTCPALADKLFTIVPPGKPTLFIGDLYTDLVAKSCLTLYDPMGCSPPGSSVHVIFQGRILEWVVTSFYREFSPPTDWTWASWIAGRFFTNWATREVRWLYIFIHMYPCFKIFLIKSGAEEYKD